MFGTAVLNDVANDETGELETATAIGEFNEVLKDFTNNLQRG